MKFIWEPEDLKGGLQFTGFSSEKDIDLILAYHADDNTFTMVSMKGSVIFERRNTQIIVQWLNERNIRPVSL